MLRAHRCRLTGRPDKNVGSTFIPATERGASHVQFGSRADIGRLLLRDSADIGRCPICGGLRLASKLSESPQLSAGSHRLLSRLRALFGNRGRFARMEHTMLAELFIMRLEAKVRASKEVPDRDNRRFVPLDSAAEATLKQSSLDWRQTQPKTDDRQGCGSAGNFR